MKQDDLDVAEESRLRQGCGLSDVELKSSREREPKGHRMGNRS